MQRLLDAPANETVLKALSRLNPKTVLFILQVLLVCGGVMGAYYKWFLPARQRGLEDSCVNNLYQLESALNMYYHDQKAYPPTLESLSPQYCSEVWVCPSSGSRYQVTYSQLQPPIFTVLCSGDSHAANGRRPNFPQYTSENGCLREPLR